MDIFLNGAYAWNSALDVSGRNGPSTYPDTALGLRVRHRFNEQWTVKAAVLDGVPDSENHPRTTAINFNKTNGAFVIGEVDYSPIRNTKIMAGVWDYTGKLAAINQINADGTQHQVFSSRGGYIGGATRVYNQGGGRSVDLFATLGIADGRTDPIDGSLNFGLTYTGPIASRPSDKLGLAAGIVQASSAFHRQQTASGVNASRYERNVELTYRAQVNDWLTIQPDIQYFSNPGFDTRRKDDLLFIVHFEVGHLFGL